MLNQLKPWTITISHDTTDDDGKSKRVKAAYQVLAVDIPSAYNEVEQHEALFRNLKMGCIIPGHHVIPL